MSHTEMANMSIRLDKDLRDAFNECCKRNESDGSKEIRKFMKKYLAEHGQETLDMFSEKKRK